VNVFNSIMMTLLILLLIVLVVYVMVLPSAAHYSATEGLKVYEQDIVNGNLPYTWFLVGGAAILLLLLVLFVLEVRKPRRKAVRIKTQAGGSARLDITSVAQSLEYRVDELAGVRQVKTRITSRGKDVDVELDLDTSPSMNIPVLTDQVIALCHDIVEGQLGIQIHGRPVINIKHEPYPRGTMPSTKPLGGAELVAPTPAAANTPAAEAPSYGSNLGLGEALDAAEQQNPALRIETSNEGTKEK